MKNCIVNRRNSDLPQFLIFNVIVKIYYNSIAVISFLCIIILTCKIKAWVYISEEENSAGKFLN